jgi:hypothetical protein
MNLKWRAKGRKVFFEPFAFQPFTNLEKFPI